MSETLFAVRYNGQIYKNGDTINATVGDTVEIVYYDNYFNMISVALNGTVAVGGTAIENGFTYTEQLQFYCMDKWVSIGSVIISGSGTITVDWNGEVWHYNPDYPMGTESGHITVNVNTGDTVSTTVLVRKDRQAIIGNTWTEVLQPDIQYLVGTVNGMPDLPDILYCSINNGTSFSLSKITDEMADGLWHIEYSGGGVLLAFTCDLTQENEPTDICIQFDSSYYPNGVEGTIIIDTVETNPPTTTDISLIINGNTVASKHYDTALSSGYIDSLGETDEDIFRDITVLYLNDDGTVEDMGRTVQDEGLTKLYKYEGSKLILTATYDSISNKTGIAFNTKTDLSGQIVISNTHTEYQNYCVVSVKFENFTAKKEFKDGFPKGQAIPICSVPVNCIPDMDSPLYLNINGNIMTLNPIPVQHSADTFSYAWSSDDRNYIVGIYGQLGSSEGTVNLYIAGTGVISGTIVISSDRDKSEDTNEGNQKVEENITVKYHLVYPDLHNTIQVIDGSVSYDKTRLDGWLGHYSGETVVSNLPPANIEAISDKKIRVKITGFYKTGTDWKPVTGELKLPFRYKTLEGNGAYAVWYLNDISGTLTDDEGNSLTGFVSIQVAIKTYTNITTGTYTEVKMMLVPVGVGNYSGFKGTVLIELIDYEQPTSEEVQIYPVFHDELPAVYKDNIEIRKESRLHPRNIPLPSSGTTISYPLYIVSDIEYRLEVTADRSDTRQSLPVNVDLANNKVDIDLLDASTGGYTVYLHFWVYPDW